MTADEDAEASARKYPSIPQSSSLSDSLVVILREGRMENVTPQVLSDAIESLTLPRVGVISQSVTAAEFTDGGVATGTLEMTDTLPAGAVVIGTKVLVSAGFAGNVSATLTIGDGSDVDRFNTGTPSVFATAATGIVSGPPSGNPLVFAAVAPVLTVVSATDFTLVLAGGGAMSVAIYYIVTV